MPRILQLTNKPVWPAVEGGPMAMAALTRSLVERGFEVKLLSISTPKFPPAPIPADHPVLSRVAYETIFIDTTVKPLPALKSLFSAGSYHISRFYSDAFAMRLSEILRSCHFDLIIMETIYMVPYLETIRKVAPEIPLVLRAHNIEHLIWQRIAAGERNPLKRWYLKHLTSRLMHAEISSLQCFRAIIPISAVDAHWFSDHAPETEIKPVPFGINPISVRSATRVSRGGSIRAYHLGSMDWYPNLEAVSWLLDKCWPHVAKKFPDATLHLAGRNMPDAILEKRLQNVTIQSEVPDASEFIRDKQLLIAPIFSGSGIRIKILEAMAMGKVVLTTPVGAEGIEYTDSDNILIFNNIKELLDRFEQLVCHPGEMDRIGNNAAALIQRKYHPEMLAEELELFLKSLIKG
jgi:polysaccharide biosynthesis protein PslH